MDVLLTHSLSAIQSEWVSLFLLTKYDHPLPKHGYEGFDQFTSRITNFQTKEGHLFSLSSSLSLTFYLIPRTVSSQQQPSHCHSLRGSQHGAQETFSLPAQTHSLWNPFKYTVQGLFWSEGQNGGHWVLALWWELHSSGVCRQDSRELSQRGQDVRMNGAMGPLKGVRKGLHDRTLT